MFSSVFIISCNQFNSSFVQKNLDINDYTNHDIFALENDSIKANLLLLKSKKLAETSIPCARFHFHLADSIIAQNNFPSISLKLMLLSAYLDIYDQNWKEVEQTIMEFETNAQSSETTNFPLYYYCKGQHFNHKGNIDSALYYYQAIIPHIDSLSWEYALFQERQASAYSYLGLYHQAMNHVNKSIDCYRFINDSIGLSLAIKIKGDIHYSQGNYDKASKSFYQSIAYINTQKNPDLLATIYNNIGNIYSKLNSIEKALDFYNRSLIIYDSLNNNKGRALAYNNLGVIFEKKMLLDSAMNYHQLSLKINDEINNYKGSAFALANIGSIYQEKKQSFKSIKYYEKSLQISKDRNDSEGVIVGHLALGSAYFDLKDYYKATNHLLNSLNLSDAHGWAEYSSRNSKLLSELYKETNRDDLALEYHIKYSKYLIQFQSNQLTEIETRFENIKKEEEINKLNFDKTLQKKRIDILRVRFIATLFFAIITLSFLAFYIRLFLIKKRALIDLADKNIAIAKSAQTSASSLEVESDLQNEEKYSTSAMDKQLKNELYIAINNEFKNHKVYLKSDLNLQKLSSILNTNKMYVSQVISEKTGKHFNNYVNEFRINEARQLIIEGKCKSYTIQSIAEMVGFNSLSSFNKAFKKYTGITPSFFVKQVEKKANILSSD